MCKLRGGSWPSRQPQQRKMNNSSSWRETDDEQQPLSERPQRTSALIRNYGILIHWRDVIGNSGAAAVVVAAAAASWQSPVASGGFQNCGRPSIMRVYVGSRASVRHIVAKGVHAAYTQFERAPQATLRIRNVRTGAQLGFLRLIAESNGISQHVKWSVYVSLLSFLCMCACVCACSALIMPIAGAVFRPKS